MKLLQEIVFKPAYDKRHSDPKKNYGIHGVDMTWYLKGEEGTVQFVVYTGWHLPNVIEEQSKDSSAWKVLSRPLPADIGYHSKVPQYSDQTCMDTDCDAIIGGGPCYYDGSTLGAEVGFQLLVREGSDAVWKWMDDYYKMTFIDASVSD